MIRSAIPAYQEMRFEEYYTAFNREAVPMEPFVHSAHTMKSIIHKVYAAIQEPVKGFCMAAGSIPQGHYQG